MIASAQRRAMYTIRQRTFGYELTLRGRVIAAEMKGWYHEVCRWLGGPPEPFAVLVDASRCEQLSKAAGFWLLRGQQRCEAAGLCRAAVLFDRTAPIGFWAAGCLKAPAGGRVRYIDATRRYPRTRALCWLLRGIEPGLLDGDGAEGQTGTPSARAQPPVELLLESQTRWPVPASERAA